MMLGKSFEHPLKSFTRMYIVWSGIGMHARFDVSIALTLIISIFLMCQKCTNYRTEFLTPRLIYLFIHFIHPSIYVH